MHRHDIVFTRYFFVGASEALSSRISSPHAQPFIEMFSIHHADVAAVDGHVNRPTLRGNHARRIHFGNDEFIRNLILVNQYWRNCATAGLDAPGAVKQRNFIALSREHACRSRPGGPATDYNHIKNLC